MIKMKTIFCLL